MKATAENVLQSEAGKDLCRAMRRETWFTHMMTSPDPTMRRLGAATFVAAAMDMMVPSRAAWDEKPSCPHCGRSCGNSHRCVGTQVSTYFKDLRGYP